MVDHVLVENVEEHVQEVVPVVNVVQHADQLPVVIDLGEVKESKVYLLLYRFVIVKSKIIYIVRHGAKVRGIGDVSISERGIQQAHKAAIYLLSKKIQYICSSPALRTMQTAEMIGHLSKKKIHKDVRLKERLDFGEDDITDYQYYIHLCGKSTFDRSYILPNGNTSINCGKLFKTVVDEIMQKKYSHSLIVSHGGIIADFLRNEFGDEYLDTLSRTFAKYRIVRTCSITTISVDENTGKIKLLELNGLHHLL